MKIEQDKEAFATQFWANLHVKLKDRGLGWKDASQMAQMEDTWASSSQRRKVIPNYLQVVLLADGLNLPVSRLVGDVYQSEADQWLQKIERLPEDQRNTLSALIETYLSTQVIPVDQ